VCGQSSSRGQSIFCVCQRGKSQYCVRLCGYPQGSSLEISRHWGLGSQRMELNWVIQRSRERGVGGGGGGGGGGGWGGGVTCKK